MIRTYFNQAFHLIRQNPLFSGFYILGTGLAISMVMLLVVIYYIKVPGTQLAEQTALQTDNIAF